MHTSYLKSVLSESYAIIEELIPQSRSCKLWAREFGQWMEIEAIDDAKKTIGSYKACDRRGCIARIRQRKFKGHCEDRVRSQASDGEIA